MSMIISQESKKQLWVGIERYFLNHPNEFIQKSFKLNRHDDKYQNSLIAAAVDVIFISKIAAHSIRNVFDCRLILRDAVNRGRTDNSVEAELKIYMINNIIDENAPKEQLDMILSTNVRQSSVQAVRGVLVSSFNDKEIRRFREIVAQFKRDYIMIFEEKDFMNNEHLPENYRKDK